MSDATSPPPPRSSSTAPEAEGRQRADSSSGEGEFDTSLDQSTGTATREDSACDFEGRTDNKQKRKRTRYVWGVFISVGTFGYKLWLVQLMHIWAMWVLRYFWGTLLTFLSSSPQDQAILEAEYKQNPKPNKAARAEIVEKVSLNEKEVQVSNYTHGVAGLHSDAFTILYFPVLI